MIQTQPMKKIINTLDDLKSEIYSNKIKIC